MKTAKMSAVLARVNLSGGKNMFSEQVRHAFTGCVVALAVFSLVSLAHGQEYSPTFRSFSGTCRHTRDPLRSLYDNALGWGRQDIEWNVLEPYAPNDSRHVWRQSELNSYGNLVLAYNAKGANLLPILDYGTNWAGGYRFIDNGHIVDWQNYVERVVDFLRKPPYNVKYFQIWNEPDYSVFWTSDMDTFMTNVHLPASEVIHNLGCKVVFGGWLGAPSDLVDLLDRHNAWDSVDVLDVHYKEIGDLQYLRDAAAARGYENMPIWETEVGGTWHSTPQLHYISNFYPRLFYWALTHNADAGPDMYKAFYYREESTNTPGSDGYHQTLYSGNNLWYIGTSLQTLGNLFNNGMVSAYQDVTNNRSLTPQQDTSVSSIESFKLYDRVVTAIHLNAADVSNPSTDTITLTYSEFQSPSDVGSIKRVDVAGYETNLTGSYGVSGLTVTVPVANDPCSPVQNWGLDSSVYNFYVVVTQMGSLSVTINPQGAIDAGAQWRRAGTSTWRNSGYTESEISIGQYTVEFSSISGWNAPANQIVQINNSQTTYASGTYNFIPQYELTMAVSPSAGGITIPSVGTTIVFQGIPNPIVAQANAGYSLMSWTAIPAENVVFENANAPSTTATLSGNATVTANFNSQPVADINATLNVVILNEANSVTLDATSSTDDGLPNPPGTLTYYWQKVSGPDTYTIVNPDAAVTDVLFWGLGSYEFSVTVSDGQLQDVKSVTIDVVVNVAYVANNGDDNTGLGTIENPFATIQKGINTVQDNGTVIALEGTYHENIDFGGKKITVRSNNPNDTNVVANSVIDANGSGGVVIFDSGEDTNSVLAGFTITGGDTELGGGIYINAASPVVERNVIRGNRASSEGGGIYCQGGSATIRYNKISNNYSGFAGGVSFESSFAVLQNNLIVDNNADFDSGVVCVEGQPRIVNNTIAGNAAVYEDDSSGLIIASSLLPPIISNNIIAFNDGAPGVVDFGGFDPNYFSYNDVYGHQNGNYLSRYLPMPDQTGVNGNISADPLFADTNANDYHLLPESLLIDAGDPSSDWSNEPRPNGGRINMGAYGNTSEASCSVAGDITWDKKVDFKDFAKLASYWLQNEPSVDIAPLVSGDNIVDVWDLAVLAEHWLEGI
jgi:hypothetical protein